MRLRHHVLTTAAPDTLPAVFNAHFFSGESTMRRKLPAVQLFILLSLASAPAAGQTVKSPGTRARVPVTIALSDQFPERARFVVRRVPGHGRGDLILLRPNTTAAELTEAVATLLTARQAEGDAPSTKRTVRIRPTQQRRGPLQEYPWISRVLTDLRAAPPVEIPDVGKVRAVQIWLPRQSKGPSPRPKAQG